MRGMLDKLGPHYGIKLTALTLIPTNEFYICSCQNLLNKHLSHGGTIHRVFLKHPISIFNKVQRKLGDIELTICKRAYCVLYK